MLPETFSYKGLKEFVCAPRHHDDEYWDEIELCEAFTQARIQIVPRYKMSEFSGDEWRVSAEIVLAGRGRPKRERFSSLRWAMAGLQEMVFAELPIQDILLGPATLTVKRKSIQLVQFRGKSIGNVLFGLELKIVRANETGEAWFSLTDNQEREHCCQVGCSAAPTRLYRMKKVLVAPDGAAGLRDFTPWEGRYRWFCERHALRGDCGLEDRDDNYISVIGKPVGEGSVYDRSPSMLAIDLIEDDGK